MKARPILFSGPMIQALLDGRKTQTRRVVKPQPPVTVERCANFALMPPREDGTTHVAQWMPGMLPLPRCPYGQPGDLLWVRETGWERPERTLRMIREGADTWEPYYYDADGLGPQDHEDFKRWGFKRRPSIHMPRWASRLTLRLTDVRVERVQDISEEDAKAEGMQPGPRSFRAPASHQQSPEGQFADLWDSLNPARGFGWNANPWVWALSFEVIHANVDEVTRDAA